MSDRDPKSTRESFDAFKEVVTRFPDSRYAADSALRMRYLVNALASHEVHVARYYMKRGAYLAAANRAQYAIQHYPQAPAIEEAVFVLVLGLRRARHGRPARRGRPRDAQQLPGQPLSQARRRPAQGRALVAAVGSRLVSKILVIGAAGMIGRKLVERARAGKS